MTTRAQYRADWSRAKYARLRSEGKCTRCRKPARRGPVCWTCEQKRLQARREMRRAGLCRCKNVLKRGYRQCEDCLAADRERKRAA